MSEPAENGREKMGNRRSAARLAAVQALYEMDLADAGADAVLEEFFQKRWCQDPDESGEDADSDDSSANMVAPDNKWLRELVHGVASQREELDGLIGPALSGEWTVKRLEALLRVILRAGVFELKSKPNVPANVVISEYLDVAHAFFGDNETSLVNGVLDHLARELRAGEF
jgi:N utilization substance protein B